MKERRIVKHEQAPRDLGHRPEYIRQDNPRAALRALDAAEAPDADASAQPTG